MAAIVCGKRSFFEDVESAALSPSTAYAPAYKKFRCSSAVASAVRFAYSSPVSPVDQLKAMFPDMEVQLLTKAFEDSGYNLYSAINALNELRLDCAKKCNSGIAAEENVYNKKFSSEETQPQNNLPVDGPEWVDLIVKEMKDATSIDDAKSRAARVLENLEKSIRVQASVQVAEGFHKENLMLKERNEALVSDNSILKRAVAIQHERQKESDGKNQEALQLKQLVAQYQEQLRTLEMNNYALTVQLRQAQLSKPVSGWFNPDVY
ncbi:hypothetical protein CASFOL_038686 [Castilleja foliolosa]|uniref:CUE domain-containing protein n=1 Tax=Castilleja foliolosa TaxID=1961234 RepID=A0ABD3BLS8_9LAMI